MCSEGQILVCFYFLPLIRLCIHAIFIWTLWQLLFMIMQYGLSYFTHYYRVSAIVLHSVDPLSLALITAVVGFCSVL